MRNNGKTYLYPKTPIDSRINPHYYKEGSFKCFLLYKRQSLEWTLAGGCAANLLTSYIILHTNDPHIWYKSSYILVSILLPANDRSPPHLGLTRCTDIWTYRYFDTDISPVSFDIFWSDKKQLGITSQELTSASRKPLPSPQQHTTGHLKLITLHS
jgi:hypothetical protein